MDTGDRRVLCEKSLDTKLLHGAYALKFDGTVIDETMTHYNLPSISPRPSPKYTKKPTRLLKIRSDITPERPHGKKTKGNDETV